MHVGEKKLPVRDDGLLVSLRPRRGVEREGLKGTLGDRTGVRSVSKGGRRETKVALQAMDAALRLRGGGGDGGSTGTESRETLLKMRAGYKPQKADRKALERARWTRCALGGEPLAVPIVCDGVGTLYNKTAVLEALVKKNVPNSMKHVRNIKDVMELKLTPKPKDTTEKTDDPDGTGLDFQCPVTGLDFNGTYKFYAVSPAGQVVSEKAIKEFPDAVSDLVGGDVQRDQLIPINPPEEEAAERRLTLLERQALRDATKKTKKKRKRTDESKAIPTGA